MNRVLLLVMVLCLGLMVVPVKAAVYYELWGHVIAPIGEGEFYVDANGDGNPDPALRAIDWLTVPAPDGELNVGPFGELNNFKVGPSNDWAETYTYRQIAILNIATAGNYSFWGDGDDGIIIFVDGVLVANFDGLHGGEGAAPPDPGFGKTVAPIALSAGPHLIEVLFYEQGGGDFLEVRYAMSSNENDAVFIADGDLSLPLIVNSPAAYAGDVPLAGETLSWTNPLGGSQFNVYFGTSPQVGDPNNKGEYLVATVNGTSVSLDAIAGGALINDTRYFVRIDTVAEPNNVLGAMFMFDSMRMAPIVTGDPVSVSVGPGGCLGAFSVTATSGINDDGGDLSYQWYDDNGAINGEIGDTLVTDAEGSYYCVVTNAWGETASASAVLTIVTGESVLYDFEGGGPGFTVNGDATVHDGSMRLTRNAGSLSGSVIFDPISTDPVADFKVSFDFLALNATGADGLSFALLNSSVYGPTAIFGESGPGAASLSIGIDLYDNGGEAQVGGNYFDIRLNNVVVASAVPSFTMEGTGWHHVDISFRSNLLTLVVTRQGGLPETLFDAVPVTGYTPFVGRFGFGARTGGVSNEHRVDNVLFGGPDWKVTDPQYSPAQDGNGWINPDVDLTLTWEKAVLGPCGGQVAYDVIWTKDEAVANDPNAEPYVTVSDMQAVIAAADLNYEDEIYWRVDVRYGGITQKGDVWYVEAIKLVPDVVAQPVDTFGRVGETVSFTFNVSSQTQPVTYEWKKQGSDEIIGTAATLQIVVAEDSGGRYTCTASNPSGPKTSRAARLEVARMVAHYTFDTKGQAGEPDFVEDSSGEGHHGLARGNVSIVQGKIGDGAYSFGGTSSDFVEIGRWNPSEVTNRLSVACWAKWTGTGATWQGIIGKRDAWNDTDNYWHLECSFNGDSIYFQSWTAGQLASGGWSNHIDQWTHIIATFDGTRGIMYINGEPAVSGNFSFARKPDSTLVIGSSEANGGNPWSGLIDDVKIYNYALTPVEASSIYVADTGATGVCSEFPEYDLNGDCVTDLADFAIFMQGWMECNLIPCDRW
ncbi:MAG: immunoglobulin domain-containing protein [Phycisphaerae bacterium]|nr:immunoglobulin domain-containing protein [Phycisphaerae bacterium]